MRGRGKTILLVEDHPQQRSAIRTLLQRMGFDTVEASDAASAIKRLAACTPDVICLDLVLPESSGYDLCEFIRRSPRHRATPVLMMSDRAYPVDRAHAAEVGADAFIRKPFSAERLRRWIEALLRTSQPPPFEP
jgi:two-component system chemotaxis response regulator CheY